MSSKPALRISHIVYGREHKGNRVTYLVDPQGRGTLRAVPESVVLRRWRQRKLPGYRFSGARLSSTLWRAVDHALGTNARSICILSIDQIETALELARPNQGYMQLPAANVLHALFSVCGPDRLQALLNRHLSEDHEGRSGVPDLFLFAIEVASGNAVIARFVEVKKPEEPVSLVQKAEIALMNDLGLHARVLRLQDR